MKNNVFDEFRSKADRKNRAAMDELERRGFRFLIDFGYKNAAERLRAMDVAARQGRLYEHLRRALGR